MTTPTLAELLIEYDRACTYSNDLTIDLTDNEIRWRADESSSAIGWHLGHQPAVAHYMVRNLTAAEPPIDEALESLMDSATPETQRGEVPDLATLKDFRGAVAERVHFHVGSIDAGEVGAPAQLRIIGRTLMTAIINHEYQHAKWIGEVRRDVHGRDLPPNPVSELLRTVDGYFMLA